MKKNNKIEVKKDQIKNNNHIAVLLNEIRNFGY